MTCTLPAILFLVVWWKRPVLKLRDLLLLLPFFAVGVAMGLSTAWLEKSHVGAMGVDWDFGVAEKALIAGRVFWFYATKLLWPHPLIFVYERWNVDTAVWWQYAFPAGFIGVTLAFWLLRRRIGKGPLVAVLFFAGTLLPASGFFDVFPMLFSFVADHFQYLASIGIIVLFCSTFVSFLDEALASSWRRRGGLVVAAALLCFLGMLTWKRGPVFRNPETLWRDTMAQNPSAWIAYVNLGQYLGGAGRIEEAIECYREALRIRPETYRAHYDLAALLRAKGRTAQAAAHLLEVVRLETDHFEAHDRLGQMLVLEGRMDEAIPHFAASVRIEPRFARGRLDLGDALYAKGRIEEAVHQYREFLKLQPQVALVHNRLGLALEAQGQPGAAIRHYRRALKLRPDLEEARENLSRLEARPGMAAEERVAPEDSERGRAGP